MVILTDNNDVILSIGNEVIEDENEQSVVWIDGVGYGLIGQQIHEVENIPEYVVPDKYKYLSGEFVFNESYVNLDEEKELINTLGQELATLKIQLIMGGII